MQNQIKKKNIYPQKSVPPFFRKKEETTLTSNHSPFPFPELIQMKANVTNKVIVIE